MIKEYDEFNPNDSTTEEAKTIQAINKETVHKICGGQVNITSILFFLFYESSVRAQRLIDDGITFIVKSRFPDCLIFMVFFLASAFNNC